MDLNTTINALRIRVREPLASFLGGPTSIETFEISLKDAARFSGHLCPTVVGAFLMTRAAVLSLFDDGVCERGSVEVFVPNDVEMAATGPLSNVISYITGAWGVSGFNGINGKFRRKNLMHFGSSEVSPEKLRFENTRDKRVVEVWYDPSVLDMEELSVFAFPESWQKRIALIIENIEKVVHVEAVR